MDVRGTVSSVIESVALEHHKTLPPLTDDLGLLDTELDSLCLAVIVARLEDELGIDPFRTAEDAPFPVTIGDFISFYESALV